MDIDDNAELTNKAVEESSLLSANKNDEFTLSHKRHREPLKKRAHKKKALKRCPVAETSDSSEIVSLDIHDVGS